MSNSTSEPKTKPCACGSDAIEPELLKPGQPGYGTHYSKLICCDCGKFNGWGRDPKVTAAAKEREIAITDLLAAASLNSWERGFLVNVLASRHLTDKQRAHLTKIQEKYRR